MVECDLKNKSEELVTLNPYGKVPVLVDGDTVIYESAVINEYLDEKFPEVSLMPTDLAKRAEVRIWIDFCNTRLQAAAGNIRHDHEVEKNKKRLREHLETLEKRMAGRDYIVGGHHLHPVLHPRGLLPDVHHRRPAQREALARLAAGAAEGEVDAVGLRHSPQRR